MIKCFFTGKLLFHQSKIATKTIRQHRQLRWTSTLRRSMLYLSQDHASNLEKSIHLAADCIAFDCEFQNGEETVNFRQNVKEFFDGLDKSSTKSEWCVKVNPVQEPELCEADLASVLSAKNLPDSICLPKIYNPDQLQWFAERIWNNLIKQPENNRRPVKLLMLIESTRALLNLSDLCKKAEELATMAPIVPVGLVFGGFELAADLGTTKTSSGLELLYAREKFVLTAKAFGLQAIDMFLHDRRDKNSFKDKCEEALAIGFTGKQVTNPSEVAIANEMFVPTRSKISWAKTILRKYYKNQDGGELNFENAAVDMGTFRRAEHILKVAIAVGKIKSEMEEIIKEGG